MEKNVTAEVVLLRNVPGSFEIGLTLFGDPKLVSGQFRFLFKTFLDAHAHLLLDFGLQLSSDGMDNLLNYGKVSVPVDFEESAELFAEIHYQFNIHDDADFFGSYKEPIAEYSLIDVSDRDFAGELAPKDTVNEIANAVKESGRDSAFYFLAYDDKPNEPIFDVHFLTKDEIYLRKHGIWKVINPVEWDRQEGSMEWLINPEFGVEFLRDFDRGGMTVGEGQKYSLPDDYYSDLRRRSESSDDSDSSPILKSIENSNSNSNSRDYFHCVVYEEEVHVHRIKDEFKPWSIDEYSEFGRDGGYLFVGKRDWLMIIPSASGVSTDDFEYDFEELLEVTPGLYVNMSCSEWIEKLNHFGRERFKIDTIPIDIGRGKIESFAKSWMENNLKPTGWTLYQGLRA